MPRNREHRPTPRSDALGGDEGRILRYFERNPKVWFSPRQIARYTGISEHLVLEYLKKMSSGDNKQLEEEEG